MVAWWKARGGSLKNDLDFRWSQDLHVKQSIVEAQVSTGGSSETGPRHKWEIRAQVSKRHKWEKFGGASEYFTNLERPQTRHEVELRN